MDEMSFTSSAGLSVGIELELQLVRPHDFDLSRDAGDLLARLGKRKLPGAVKPEITESMIELNSSVHSDCEALLAELETVRGAVVQDAALLNIRVCGGGSHPFHDWADRRIYPAIDIQRTSTRKEELLMDKDELNRVYLLRNFLADMPPVEALEFLLERMKRTKNNKEFFSTMAQ